MSGTPCLGHSITITTTASSACIGCTFFGFGTGPMRVSGLNVPVGPPVTFLYSSVGSGSMTVRVPINPDFLEQPVTFAAVYSDGSFLEASQPLIVQACP